MSLNFLYRFDLFQHPIQFFFGGRKKLFSSFGLLASFSLYAFLLFSFVNSDFFKKEEPIISTQSLQMPHAEKVEFFSNTTLSFGVVDPFGNRYWDPTYFSIKVYYYSSLTISEEKKLKSCDNKTIMETENMGTNFNNTFCLVNNNFTLQGSNDDSIFQYIVITLLPCDNQTTNNSCKTPEDIDNFVNSYPITKYFTLRYTNYKTDLNNYNNPFKSNTDVEAQYIDSKIQRNWYLNFKNAIVETDDGWFLSSKNTKTNIMLGEKKSDFRIRAKESDAFLKIFLQASKDKLISSRRYKKLPEVLAELCGISQFFLTIFGSLARFFIYLRTLNKVLSYLYVFPKIKMKKKRIKTNTLKKDLSATKNTETKETKLPNDNVIFNKTNSKDNENGSNKKNNGNKGNLFLENKNKCFDMTTTKESHSNKPIQKLENVFLELLIEKQIHDNDNDKCESNKNIESNKNMFFENRNKSNEMTANEDHCNPPIKNREYVFPEALSTHHNKIDKTQIQPKFLEEESVIAENFIIEKNCETPKHLNEYHNDQTFVKPSDCEIPLPSNKNLGTGLTKDIQKKSFFSKIIDSKIFSSLVIKKNLSKITDSHKVQHFKLSFLDYLHYSWCKVFQRKKLSDFHQFIQEAEKTFVKDMDTMNLVKKIHDLQKLKMLVLNEDQLVLFNFISKPIIVPSNNDLFCHAQESNRKITHLMRKQTISNNLFEESYKRVLKNEENSEINQRLIHLLDDEIKN